MTIPPASQGSLDGTCAVYAIINALSIVLPRQVTPTAEEQMLAALVDAYPGDVAALVKDGCERPEVDALLHGVLQWAKRQKWPAWEWRSLHPVVGEPTAEFLDAMRAELETPRSAALVGFGEDTKRGTRYEPHWSCVTRLSDQFIWLKDSSSYRRVPLADVGVRPAPRWAIEDCFILSRPPA